MERRRRQRRQYGVVLAESVGGERVGGLQFIHVRLRGSMLYYIFEVCMMLYIHVISPWAI